MYVEERCLIFIKIVVAITSVDFATCTSITSDPVVNTPSGQLRGSILTTWTNKKFYSFRGVPFAEPPIGNLRFKAPVPVKRWNGIRNATKDANICPQVGSDSLGPADEDCLYLNVYTKELNGARPVIVFFHPGGFFIFTGASYWAGPHYLMDHDVVLVTANYRLDALGFLSTGDKTAVGNYAMKDQVETLRWVQKHIRGFGGNPNKVTIAGYSAGSTSGLLHMLSPMSKGLFHSVIAMSSGVTSDWVTMKEPKELSIKLARLFNCSTDSSANIVECLKKLPANKVNSQFEALRIFGGNPVTFAPVVEHDFGTGEERFLTDDPVTLIKKKQFHQVPVVTGITEHEFLWWSQYVFNNATLTEELIKNFDSLAPMLFGYTRNTTEEKQKITNTFKAFYFDSKPIKKDTFTINRLGQLFSDFSIIYGQYTTARLLAKYGEKPVYFYKLSYKGRYGYNQDPVTNETIGPCHMDDLIYLIYNSKSFPLLKENDPEAFMVKLETSIWKNFAVTGNPTPDRSPVQWTPITPNEKNIKYLNIDKKLTVDYWNQSSFVERMNVWDKLFPF